jgi:hypothetical protein
MSCWMRANGSVSQHDFFVVFCINVECQLLTSSQVHLPQ